MGGRRNENQEHQERLLAELGYDSTVGNPVDLMIEAQGSDDLAPDEREERMFDLMRSAEQAVSSRYARRDACIARAADEHRRLMTLRDLLDRKVEVVESAPGLVVVQTAQADPRIDRILDLLETLAKSSTAAVGLQEVNQITATPEPAVAASQAPDQQEAASGPDSESAGKATEADTAVASKASAGVRPASRRKKGASIPRASKAGKIDIPVTDDGHILGVKPTRAGWRQVPAIIAEARSAIAAGAHGNGVPDTRFYRSTWRRKLYEAVIAEELATRGEQINTGLAAKPSQVKEKAANQPVAEAAKKAEPVSVQSMDALLEDAGDGELAVLPPLADLDTMRGVVTDILKAQGDAGMNVATLHDRLKKRYDFRGRGVGYVIMLLKSDKSPFVEKNLNWYYNGA